ncbi:MAG: response regulator [bacterium]
MNSKINILIIDENNLHAHMASMALEEEGFNVKIAMDCMHGLTVLKNFKPDLLITEWEIKKMDIIDYYSEIRKNQNELPIIIYTNIPIESIAEEIRHNPKVSYINKEDGAGLLVEQVKQDLAGIL